MNSAVEVFLDIYDHARLDLTMLKTFVTMSELTTDLLYEYKYLENSHIYIKWYDAAIIYSKSKGKDIKERCKIERNLRKAWKVFIQSRVKEEPMVPDIPY